MALTVPKAAGSLARGPEGFAVVVVIGFRRRGT